MTQRTIIQRQAYVTPDTSVVAIRQEQCFLASGNNTLSDMDYNDIFDEDF